MPDPDDIEACKDAVVGYCTAINDWEVAQTIIDRIAKDQFVSEPQRKAVDGITLDSHNKEHGNIFRLFVVPRDRNYGSNPGEPKSWGNKGSFFDIDRQTIESVEIASRNRAELTAGWGYQLPGGRTMFVLKRVDGSWLIDSLKVWLSDSWEVAHL